jgi:hypothetical protein
MPESARAAMSSQRTTEGTRHLLCAQTLRHPTWFPLFATFNCFVVVVVDVVVVVVVDVVVAVAASCVQASRFPKETALQTRLFSLPMRVGQSELVFGSG